MAPHFHADENGDGYVHEHEHEHDGVVHGHPSPVAASGGRG
jgi:hypothetical protein